MVVLVATAALLVRLGGTAYGQADTSRPRPLPAPTIRALTPTTERLRSADSGRALDIEAVEVIKGAGTGGLGDRLGPGVRRRMLETLAAQRRVWAERRPRSYVIRTAQVGHCIIITRRARAGGQVLREQLVVRDTAVVGRRPAPIAELYAHQCHLAWRVEDLFADLTRALADTMTYVHRLEYDPAYGFPRAYWLEHGDPYVANSRPQNARDGGVLVESFTPAP